MNNIIVKVSVNKTVVMPMTRMMIMIVMATVMMMMMIMVRVTMAICLSPLPLYPPPPLFPRGPLPHPFPPLPPPPHLATSMLELPAIGDEAELIWEHLSAHGITSACTKGRVLGHVLLSQGNHCRDSQAASGCALYPTCSCLGMWFSKYVAQGRPL